MLGIKATTVSLVSIDRFHNSLCAKGRSEKTAKAYRTDLKIFLMEIAPEEETWEKYEVPMEEFEELGMNWLQANRKRLSPKTTNRRLTSLNSYAKWAGWGDVLRDYSPPTPAKGQPHPLPEGIEGVHKLIEVAHNEKQKSLIALCGLCGLRIGEALGVRGRDFDLFSMDLTVRGKGDKTRIVPVSERAWNILAVPIARSILNNNVEVVGLKDRFARRVVTELGMRAGLKRRVASHDLRATFATALYDTTLDQRLVQEILGHSSGTTTEVYIERSSTQKRTAIEAL